MTSSGLTDTVQCICTERNRRCSHHSLCGATIEATISTNLYALHIHECTLHVQKTNCQIYKHRKITLIKHYCFLKLQTAVTQTAWVVMITYQVHLICRLL